MLAAIRVYSYAVWLGLPFMAVALADVFAGLKIKNIVPKFLAALLITPAAVTLGSIMIAQAAGQEGLLDLNSAERQACVHKENYAPLAALPAGLVAVNALEWAPYILAWTPQPLLGAPYHRMPAGILSSHRIFASSPDDAQRVVGENRVVYVVICGSHAPEGISRQGLAASLWTQLQAGAVPGWLERLPQSSDPGLVIYRVKG
jgi:hypothetical protein